MAETIAIAGIVFPTAATLAAPVLQHLLKKTNGGKDPISLADLHEQLESGLERLLAVQRDKENEVSRDIIQKDKSEVYKVWEKNVSNIKEEKNSLDKEYVKLKEKKWLFGKKRRLLEDKIRKALQKVVQLLEQCSDKSMVHKPTERVIKETGVPSIAEYTTLNSALQEIQELLKKNEVKCVALHGQKGVGKTTIMQHLNNHFYKSIDKEFDMVIFIKVPAYKQTEELEGNGFKQELHILQKIGERIKVERKKVDGEGNEFDDGEGNEFDEAARTMQSALEKIRYLLILDGVKRPLTLDRIWAKLDISKHIRDSKVVITTDCPLFGKLKCVNRKVNLQMLSPEEAWGMFEKQLPNDAKVGVARRICERFCCRLPLLITPIAKSFNSQVFPVDWESALADCTPWPQVGVDGLKEVYLWLKTFWLKRLQSREVAQKCFLYASLYPANSKICTKYFVECCIAQGFLDDDANTRHIERRRKAIEIQLKGLVNVAFLEAEEQMRYVKMDGLYRDFALDISSTYSYSKCRTYVNNEEHDECRPVGPESWQDVRWVSMIGTKRDSLKTNQDCESLQTLLLQKNMELVEIPSNYFESMGELRVLNLYCTKINKLPSLEGLTKLKALYLNGCSELKIESLEEIEPLIHLEIFDIRDTRVDFVPCLESLLSLRISYIASCDQSGDPGTYHPISMLHKLEELTIEVKSPQEWCTNAECIIEKVASLKNLTTFRCRFPSSETLKEFLETSKSWRDEKQFHFNFSWDVKNQNIQESLSFLII